MADPSSDGSDTNDAGATEAGASTRAPPRPYTLSLDVGGTGPQGQRPRNGRGDGGGPGQGADDLPHAPRRRWWRGWPPWPRGSPEADRISCGFPGMVRRGRILSAPHFVTTNGPGSEVDPELVDAWARFDFAAALTEAIGKPCRVANDADVQGSAVVRGDGFEAVITLGTGFGTAFFMDGRLLPHQEFSHVEFRKGETFNEQLGEAARKKVGDKRWNRRVRRAIAYLDTVFFFDHLFVGGGNSPRVDRRDLGPVLDRVTVVDNSAGILGGIKLWDDHHLALNPSHTG